jgi:hypothetical protein
MFILRILVLDGKGVYLIENLNKTNKEITK